MGSKQLRSSRLFHFGVALGSAGCRDLGGVASGVVVVALTDRFFSNLCKADGTG